jgi:hypothetical protein
VGGGLPATRADRVRTPLLLVYGQDSMGPTHGVAWFTVLRDHGVPCELVLYDDEGHLFSRPENKADMVPGQSPGLISTRQAPDSQLHASSRVTGHQGSSTKLRGHTLWPPLVAVPTAGGGAAWGRDGWWAIMWPWSSPT